MANKRVCMVCGEPAAYLLESKMTGKRYLYCTDCRDKYVESMNSLDTDGQERIKQNYPITALEAEGGE